MENTPCTISGGSLRQSQKSHQPTTTPTSAIFNNWCIAYTTDHQHPAHCSYTRQWLGGVSHTLGICFCCWRGCGGEPHQCTQHVGWSGGASGDLAVSRMQIHQHALPLRYRHNKYYTMAPAAAAAAQCDLLASSIGGGGRRIGGGGGGGGDGACGGQRRRHQQWPLPEATTTQAVTPSAATAATAAAAAMTVVGMVHRAAR